MTSGDSSSLVGVVGSANLDLVARTATLPRPGETLLASGYAEFAGGKGLNQAVAAARTAPTVLIAALGADAAGSAMRTALTSHGVSADGLVTVDAPSGRALIAVDEAGENLIVVVAGANALLTADRVTASLNRLRPGIVLTQSEVPAACVRAAADWCAATGTRFAWNASPVGDLDPVVLALCDPLLVNAGEAAALCSTLGAEADDALHLLGEHCRSVIVTLGADGLLGMRDGTGFAVAAASVTAVVDTTGAGDELAGSLVAQLSRGVSLPDACRTAVTAAATLIATDRADR